jgi:hypothetical protein
MTKQAIEKYADNKMYVVLFTSEEKPNLTELRRLFQTKSQGKIYSRSGPHSAVFSVFNQLHQLLGADADNCLNGAFSDHTTYIFASPVKCNLTFASVRYDLNAYEVTAKELDQLRITLAEFFEFVSNAQQALSSLADVKIAHDFFSALTDDNKVPIEKFVTPANIQSIGDNFKSFITPHIDARKQVLMQWVEKHRMSVA